MMNFNKSNINILSFFISSIIFLIIISILNYPQIINKGKLASQTENAPIMNNNEIENTPVSDIENEELNENEIGKKETNEKVVSKKAISEEIDKKEINEEEIEKWTIEIKSLGIRANINQIEGVTPSEHYVGHFKDTDILGKNIALIAFNYGAINNYFANLKDLKAGEEVIYTVNSEIKKYKVISNQIIQEESLNSILKDSNNEGLKLFTYVKDLDNYLRYVYAQEIIDI